MIFSELYSVYYNTVARIMEKAFEGDVTEKDLQKCVVEQAFSESVLTILPALKSGRWPLLNGDLSPVLENKPTMPLTLLEKRWLKAIFDDPKFRLFGVDAPDLGKVEPLFTKDDYKVFDQYSDGDPFEDKNYIENFRTILCAIKNKRPVKVTIANRHGEEIYVRFFPKGFEYSLKDDKIRVVADDSRYKLINLGRIKTCRFYEGNGAWTEKPKEEKQKELTLLIKDERNALERAMLHFAHFEKQAERVDEGRYILRLKYYEPDETEIVIRVLSFGPCVKVIEPESFVKLIKERLILQKSCELI